MRWERVLIPGAVRLKRMAFVDARTGWVLGERPDGASVILLTSDAGRTWRTRALSARDVRAIHFVSRETGWAVGRQAILVTRDGGENWRRQPIGPARTVRALALLDQGGGFAVGDNGLALRYVPPPAPNRTRAGERPK